MAHRHSDEVLRGQLERMLNQSGVLVTPEIMAKTGMFTIESSGNDEWVIFTKVVRMKITYSKPKYTVTLI